MPLTFLHATRATLTLVLCFLFVSCGGEGSDAPADGAPVITRFSADRTQYFVGEKATLTVAYSGRVGRIEPGVGPVASGTHVETRALDRAVTYRLVVESAGRSTARELALPVAFRDRYVALPAPFIASEHAAVTAADGSVLVIGGSRGLATLSESIDRFDPATRLFTRIGSMRTGRSGHTATRLPDGRVLVLGGASSLQIGNVADLIDERTGAVSHGGELMQPRGWHATTLLADGRVLVSGGIGRSTVEIWDPQTNTWHLVAERMAHVRTRHTSTLLADGKVLIAGGWSDGSPYRFAEIFDPQAERFAPVDSETNDARRLHAAHRLADGSVLIVGGEADAAGGGTVLLASALRFDPGTNHIGSVAPMARARTLVQSVARPDDRVLLLGGETDLGQPTPSGEAYRPGQGGGPLAAMPGARAWHTASRLEDGRILVVGGTGAGGAYVPQVLLYE